MGYFVFQKPKKELYITASVLFGSEYGGEKKPLDLIKKTQNNIQEILSGACEIDVIEDKEVLRQRLRTPERHFIYKYPSDTIHFSAVNFLTFSCIVDGDFENRREEITNEQWMKEFMKSCQEQIEKVNNSDCGSLQIRRIYMPERKRLEGSVALNAFMEKHKWLRELVNLKKEMEKTLLSAKIPNSDVRIKAYPENPEDMREYFAINLFRFIGEPDRLIHVDSLEELEEINMKLEKEPIPIPTVRLRLVISDPYLSNKKPELLP